MPLPLTPPPSRRRLPGLALLPAVLLPFLLPALALARAGGGQSYSGGSHGSGGGGGGGLIFLVFRLFFWLIFRHPLIGIPLTIVLVVLFLRYQKSRAAEGPQSWDSASVAPIAATPASPGAFGPAFQPAPAGGDLDALRTLDPEFSAVLFEDFVYDLFARAHTARASERELEALSPYLAASVRAGLAQRQPVGVAVSGAVIGALRVTGVSVPGSAGGPGAREVVILEIEANLAVGPGGTGDRTQYVEERWRLERDASVQSKPPETARAFNCPNCGAPFGPEGGTAASTAARWSPAGGSTGASRRSSCCGSRSVLRPSPRTSRRWGPTSRPSSIRSSTPAGRSWCRPTPR